MSELKRYLDTLANGPLLDPVVSTGRYVQPSEPPEGEPVMNSEGLVKRRILIREANQRAKPLVVPKRKSHKS